MSKHAIILEAESAASAWPGICKSSLESTITLWWKKSRRLGGWIETLHTEGYLFDRGPRSCRTRGSGIATLSSSKSWASNPKSSLPLQPHASATSI